MALTSPDGLAEEHRLFYVAVTRPRTALHLYTPLRYYHQPRGRSDNHGLGNTSRFLTPTIQKLCTHTRTEEPQSRVTELDVAASISVSVDELWH
jgi:DNA helicase-2/ATP-dependent DNA helicase PcrA